jgi:plasmid stabilization system protein ParE
VYKLSKKAEFDLINIWNYTLEQWGEKQADDYLQAIQSAIRLLVENPRIWENPAMLFARAIAAFIKASMSFFTDLTITV